MYCPAVYFSLQGIIIYYSHEFWTKLFSYVTLIPSVGPTFLSKEILSLNPFFFYKRIMIKLADYNIDSQLEGKINHFTTLLIFIWEPVLLLLVVQFPEQNIPNSHCLEFVQWCSSFFYNQRCLFFFFLQLLLQRWPVVLLVISAKQCNLPQEN